MTTEQNPPVTTTPAPKAEPKAAEVKRYAAYDKTYLKFVDGVFTSRSDARDAAKAAKVAKFEIREV